MFHYFVESPESTWGRQLVPCHTLQNKEKVAKVWEKEDCYMDFVLGLESEHQPGWSEVDFVYSSFNYKQHWILVAIDVNLGHILLYDSLLSYVSSRDLVQFFSPLRYTLPSRCEFCNLNNLKPDLSPAP